MFVYFSNQYGQVIFSRAPLYPDGSNELLQASAESAGGEPLHRDPLGRLKQLRLQWPGMGKTDLQALEMFFFSMCKGVARPFNYTDVEGVTRQVRFAEPQLNYYESAFERYSVTVVLLLE